MRAIVVYGNKLPPYQPPIYVFRSVRACIFICMHRHIHIQAHRYLSAYVYIHICKKSKKGGCLIFFQGLYKERTLAPFLGRCDFNVGLAGFQGDSRLSCPRSCKHIRVIRICYGHCHLSKDTRVGYGRFTNAAAVLLPNSLDSHWKQVGCARQRHEDCWTRCPGCTDQYQSVATTSEYS